MTNNYFNKESYFEHLNYPQLEESYKKIEEENKNLLGYKNELENNYKSLMAENYELNIKYENLERIFIGNQIFKEQKQSDQGMIVRNDKISQDLLNQNNQFKLQIKKLEQEKNELSKELEEKKSGFDFLKEYIKNNVDLKEKENLKNENKEIKDKLEYFQNRERELLAKIDVLSTSKK